MCSATISILTVEQMFLADARKDRVAEILLRNVLYGLELQKLESFYREPGDFLSGQSYGLQQHRSQGFLYSLALCLW